jgi:hypothetical protein
MSPGQTRSGRAGRGVARTSRRPRSTGIPEDRGRLQGLRRLRCRRSRHLLVRQREIFALLGASGSGKSTLLRLLAGFEAPSAGRIELDGEDLGGLAPYKRPVNMMFQSYALFPHMTVADNIAFGLKQDGLPRRGSSAGSRKCWRWCTWNRWRAASRTSCREDSSSAWRSRARWPRVPSCCCSTSPWARSTRNCAPRCSSRSSGSSSASASPASWSRTTRKRP